MPKLLQCAVTSALTMFIHDPVLAETGKLHLIDSKLFYRVSHWVSLKSGYFLSLILKYGLSFQQKRKEINITDECCYRICMVRSEKTKKLHKLIIKSTVVIWRDIEKVGRWWIIWSWTKVRNKKQGTGKLHCKLLQLSTWGNDLIHQQWSWEEQRE